MLTATQLLAVLTAGRVTAFILMTAASRNVLLLHQGWGQLTHHNYGETHPSASQGCWVALVLPCQAGETRVTPN